MDYQLMEWGFTTNPTKSEVRVIVPLPGGQVTMFLPCDGKTDQERADSLTANLALLQKHTLAIPTAYLEWDGKNIQVDAEGHPADQQAWLKAKLTKMRAELAALEQEGV